MPHCSPGVRRGRFPCEKKPQSCVFPQLREKSFSRMTLTRSPVETRSPTRSRNDASAVPAMNRDPESDESAPVEVVNNCDGSEVANSDSACIGSHPQAEGNPRLLGGLLNRCHHADHVDRDGYRLSEFDRPFIDEDGFVRRHRRSGFQGVMERHSAWRMLISFLVAVGLVILLLFAVKYFVDVDFEEAEARNENAPQTASGVIEIHLRGFRCSFTLDGNICLHPEKHQCVRLRSGEIARPFIIDAVPAAGVEIPACGGYKTFSEV